MFILRAVVATLSVFVITYATLSLSLAAAWRYVATALEERTSRFQAEALYLLRVTPVLVACAAALLYELPSFLLFEPLATREALTPVPVILTGIGVLAAAFSVWQMIAACQRTSDLCRQWMKESAGTDRNGLAIHEGECFCPPIAVAGVFTPQLLLSPLVSAMLDGKELDLALAHEAAHIRRRDNLRKLMLIALRFPGLASLEGAWAEATEFAADQHAVSNKSEALALASAIVKVAALRLPAQDPRALVTNFVGSESSTVMRVQKLANWQDERSKPAVSGARAAIAALAVLTTLAVSYSAAITFLHSFTEVLFR